MTIALNKPVRRIVEIRGQQWVVELSAAGVSFRLHGRRTRTLAPWRDALSLAERLAGDLAHRELLRTKALRRASRSIGR